MFKIALCDKTKESINKTLNIINDFSNNHKSLYLDVKQYTNSFDLIDDIESGESFNVLIIETLMPGISGIEVSRTIREMKIDMPIIFLTDDKAHALEAYEVSALQYLIKGKDKDKLIKVLDSLYDPERLERRIKILLSARNGIYNVYVRDIMYVESNRNYQLVALQDNEKIEVRITGKKMAELLEDNFSFKRVSSSYIVNWIFIKKMNNDFITMKDNIKIPIPRGRYQILKDACEAFYNHVNNR